MPPVPTPVPTQQNASFNTFSGTYEASGVTETSGVSGEVSGLFEIETQDLTITYYRMPRIINSVSNISLSALPTWGGNIFSTELRYEVRASYRKAYSVGQYATSAFVQNQKFRIVANPQDQYGNSYGELSAGGELTLGAAGVVATETPYYARRLVTQAGVSESSSVTVYNCAFKDGHLLYETGTDAMQAASDELSKMILATNPLEAGAFQGNRDSISFLSIAPKYNIQGGYITSKETDILVKDFVDNVGASVAIPDQFYDNVPELGGSVPQTATPRLSTATLPQYDANRHSWA